MIEPENTSEKVLPNHTPKITHLRKLAEFDEPICDLAYHKNRLYLGPYLSYKKCKIYVIDTRSGQTSIMNPSNTTVESVYRIWVSPEGQLNLQTEQPPLFYQSTDGRKWELIEKYADKGWAVLGCVTSNGVNFRGFSYRNRDTVIKFRENGKWQNLPTLGKKIVWNMAYFKGHYYAGTGPTVGYKNNHIGNVYRYDSKGKTWISVKGFETGDRIGNVVCSLATRNGLFFGTGRPQSILLMQRGGWKEFYFSEKYEISRIWQDPSERIFAGRVSKKKMSIIEWKGSKWLTIFTTEAEPKRWSVLGFATGHEMYVAYRDRDKTKVISFTYN